MEIYKFSLETLLYWIVAFSIYEWITFIFILSISKNKFKTPIEYYRVLPSWVPVFGDFIYTTAILLTAQLALPLVTQYVKYDQKYKLAVFILLAVIIQWIYDLSFAYFITSMPAGYSKYISFFQRYIKEVGIWAAISDSIWVVGWLLLTVILMNYVSLNVATLILSLSLFLWLVVKW